MASKESYQKHRVKVLAKMRRYYQEHREVIKARTRKYRLDNLEKTRAYSRIYSKQYHIKNADRRSKYSKERWQRLRRELLNDLGGEKCVKCGISDWRVLQIDHINGGGRQEALTNPKFKSLVAYGKHIRKDLSRYQVLCANCNCIKRVENNEQRKKNNV